MQAAAVWSWCNWLTAEATNAGKTLLLLNLDETPVPLTFTHSQGNVMRLDPARAWLRAPRQQSNRAAQRSYFTHVGLICNDPAVQPSRAVSCRVMPWCEGRVVRGAVGCTCMCKSWMNVPHLNQRSRMNL